MSGAGYTRGKSTTDLTSGSGSAMESQAADSFPQEDPVAIDDSASFPAGDSQVDSQVPPSPFPPAVDANESEGSESEDDDDDYMLPYHMHIMSDGTVQCEGPGGPDLYTLQLAATLKRFVDARVNATSSASSAGGGGEGAKKDDDDDDEKKGLADDKNKEASMKKKMRKNKKKGASKKKKN